MESGQDADVIRARSKRSLVKNRWAAEVEIRLVPLTGGSGATCRVDMTGTKHFALLDEIVEAVGDDAFDSRGIDEAVARLGKKGRVFGRKEVRHLQSVIHMDETVLAIAQGVYDKKQGLVVLTDQRLSLLEKSLGHESLHKFALTSINSLEVNRKRSGERLVIRASGDREEITGMVHGQADEIARFHGSPFGTSGQAYGWPS